MVISRKLSKIDSREVKLSLNFSPFLFVSLLFIINVKKTVVYTRVNGALHIENCKNYKKVITHQHIA